MYVGLLFNVRGKVRDAKIMSFVFYFVFSRALLLKNLLFSQLILFAETQLFILAYLVVFCGLVICRSSDMGCLQGSSCQR